MFNISRTGKYVWRADYRKYFSHINHVGNWWKCHGDDRDGYDSPNLYLTRFFELMYFGSTLFLHHFHKSQKLYKLNEFYSVRRWRWIKVTFLKIQILWYCTRILYRNKSLHCVIIVLPGTYWKIAAICVDTPFFVNSNDTSKIRDGDDANRRDKIFQTKTGKEMF